MLHADSAVISSTDIKIWGGKPRIGTTGSGGSVLRQCGIFFITSIVALSLWATPTIPKDSKVLGATKGKPIDTGLVFIDGKYIEPPFVVQRWGCGIKINKYPVIGEAVAWGDFVRTQNGAKVEKQGGVNTSTASVSAPAKPAVADDELDTSLDDLFDDDPKPAKSKATFKPKPVKQAPTITYSYEGEFVKNDAVKGMIKKVNDVRAEIDTQLRMGGFICFGDGYSRVSGDSATAIKLLDKIPAFQRGSESTEEFISKVRAARMEYLTEGLCADLFANRVDYRKLQERRAKWEKEAAVRKMLDDISAPTL